MSFILEALKKSEQQRQKQDGAAPQVRKRTIVVQNEQQKGRNSLLLVVLLVLGVVAGWVLYSFQEPNEPLPIALSEPVSVQPVASQPVVQMPIKEEPPKPLAPPESRSSEPDVVVQPATQTEPAPVPHPFALSSRKTTANAQVNLVSDRLEPVGTRVETVTLASAVITEPEAQMSDEPVPRHEDSDIPLYSELSWELRSRMPQIKMSLHFYAEDPSRRLARINNRLLREGDLIADDLYVVEITSTGAILEFAGMVFELRSLR